MPLKCPDCYTPMKQSELSGEKWHRCPDCGTGFSDEIYQETSDFNYIYKPTTTTNKNIQQPTTKVIRCQAQNQPL